jgi:hypothetical protein
LTEIYRNTTEYVYLDIYGGTVDAPPTAVCDAKETPHQLEVETDVAPEGVDQRWVTMLGLDDTQDPGPCDVVWSFTMNGVPVTKRDDFDVVVPLYGISEIREELELGATAEASYSSRCLPEPT